MLKLKMATSCSVQFWKLQAAAALQLIQLAGKHFRKCVLLCGIQSFPDLLVLNLGPVCHGEDLGFLSVTQCDISTENEFIASRFYSFLSCASSVYIDLAARAPLMEFCRQCPKHLLAIHVLTSVVLCQIVSPGMPCRELWTLSQ
jgi:hypothetical protein